MLLSDDQKKEIESPLSEQKDELISMFQDEMPIMGMTDEYIQQQLASPFSTSIKQDWINYIVCQVEEAEMICELMQYWFEYEMRCQDRIRYYAEENDLSYDSIMFDLEEERQAFNDSLGYVQVVKHDSSDYLDFLSNFKAYSIELSRLEKEVKQSLTLTSHQIADEVMDDFFSDKEILSLYGEPGDARDQFVMERKQKSSEHRKLSITENMKAVDDFMEKLFEINQKNRADFAAGRITEDEYKAKTASIAAEIPKLEGMIEMAVIKGAIDSKREEYEEIASIDDIILREAKERYSKGAKDKGLDVKEFDVDDPTCKVIMRAVKADRARQVSDVAISRLSRSEDTKIMKKHLKELKSLKLMTQSVIEASSSDSKGVDQVFETINQGFSAAQSEIVVKKQDLGIATTPPDTWLAKNPLSTTASASQDQPEHDPNRPGNS